MTCSPKVTVLEHGARVAIANGSVKRITLDARTVAKINANRPRTITRPGVTPVNVAGGNTTVIAGAGMGVQGRPGAPGGSIPAISFAFGDAAHVVWTPSNPGLWNYARVIIDDEFDGVGAAIQVGTLADPSIGIPSASIDPTARQEFENTPDVHLIAGQGVFLTIAPGAGATKGSGRLLLEFLPD